jgi:hypothetical protein
MINAPKCGPVDNLKGSKNRILEIILVAVYFIDLNVMFFWRLTTFCSIMPKILFPRYHIPNYT